MSANNTSKYTKFIIYMVIVVLLNIVGSTLFFRLDLTKQGVYSLSEASKHVVSTLSEPLTINVFFTKDLHAPYNNIERYLRDLLKEYSLHANSYFNYRFYNVSMDDESGGDDAQKNRKMAADYGINPVQIQVFEEDEVKFKNAYMGLVLIHGDMVERIPTISSTDGLEYKLTTAIQKLNNKISALLRLKEKISLKFYFSSSLKPVAPYMRLNDLATLPDKVKDVVDSVNSKMYGKLEYSYTDPAGDEEMEALANKYKLMLLNWPDIAEGKVKAGKGIIGLVMEYESRTKVIPILNVFRLPLFGTQYELADMDKLDEIITDNVESLIGINEDIGYLADHGTPDLYGGSPMAQQQQQQDSINTFSTLASQTYSFKDVSIKDEQIPKGLGCLVIARPTQQFSDYELFKIDQALMNGTNLALFIDAFEEVMPQQQYNSPYGQQPQYIPLNTGIEKLLEHYGIRIKRSYAMDESSYKQRLPKQFGGGQKNLYYAPIIERGSINQDIEFMQNIKSLVTLKISPLELDETVTNKAGIEALRLFSTSDRSWEMRGRIDFNPMMMKGPSDDTEMASMPLAYILKGSFPSYFAGKDIPEKVVEKDDDDKEKQEKPISEIKGTGTIIEKSKPAKIFLIASSEMLRNNLLDAQGQSPNSMFVMNILDVLNDREDTARMRSKVQTFNPLDKTDARTKAVIKTANIIGLPAVVIIFGLVALLRRHVRRKQITMIFQK